MSDHFLVACGTLKGHLALLPWAICGMEVLPSLRTARTGVCCHLCFGSDASQTELAAQALSLSEPRRFLLHSFPHPRCALAQGLSGHSRDN